ncbi:endonuclease domain-containing protein [Demequina sp. NBRC 110056]|uniref:endonuclease domain-containing protein n=1 Tax=Demequina sp. NBRC 110056 TaxID=1570345 RepID=UPI00135652C1|nr:DUF559 domain-containing protein [Demequina sp. NBRC 110056]
MLEERWSGATLSEAMRRGLVARIAPGQYAHRDHVGDVSCRLRAVRTWMAPHGAVSGLAGLWLRGWRVVRPERIDVTLPRDIRLSRPPYVDTFRTDDEVARVVIAGTPTVSAEDAALMVWRRARPESRRGLLLDVLRDGPVEARALPARIDATRRLPDRAGLLKVVALAREGVQSMLEFIAATEVFHGPEWREWERQAPVRAGHAVLHPDMVHRAGSVAIELDSARYHSDDQQRRRDIERDALLASVGFIVIRLTWEDVTRRPDWCRERARQALRARRT